MSGWTSVLLAGLLVLAQVRVSPWSRQAPMLSTRCAWASPRGPPRRLSTQASSASPATHSGHSPGRAARA
eukprot:4309068-Alexandrium_andersonii.AAC.1